MLFPTSLDYLKSAQTSVRYLAARLDKLTEVVDSLSPEACQEVDRICAKALWDTTELDMRKEK